MGRPSVSSSDPSALQAATRSSTSSCSSHRRHHFIHAVAAAFGIAASGVDLRQPDQQSRQLIGVAEGAGENERLVAVCAGQRPPPGLPLAPGQALELGEQRPRSVLSCRSNGACRDLVALTHPFEEAEGFSGETELEAARSTSTQQRVDSPFEVWRRLIDVTGQREEPPEHVVGLGVECAAVAGCETAKTAGDT